MSIKLLFIITFFASGHGLKLKQVIVLSRHNIRTPLTTNMEVLTPKKWPIWNGNVGNLTPKGRLLERAMGKYFSDWMIAENLFDNNCQKDEVFIYANTRERTKETAKAFAEGAFGNCVDVYYKNITEMDPVFNPVIRNSSQEFRETVLREMRRKLKEMKLRDAFLELNRIVDFKDSSYCKTEHVCDLSKAKSEIVFELNKEPEIAGGLQIGNTLVDAFMMAYYNGMASEDVAWGQIKTTKSWDTLLMILKTYHGIRFETKILDKDEASTLLEYLSDVFQNGKKKFYILVGHDSNINSLMSSLSFKDYVLHDQFERTPTGGKLVFQKWYDDENNKELLRVNYVYHSIKQLRDGVEVSLQNPPQWQILELENCTVDKNGFCLWNDFINILNTI